MATQLLFPNNATSTLLGNVGPTDTTFALAGGTGGRFPSPAANQSFMLTVESDEGVIEIVEVTERNTDILTVIRGREGTSATSFLTGAVVECRLTAGMLRAVDFREHDGEPSGSVVLDEDGQIPIERYQTTVTTYGDVRWNVRLGYTPVQMGTGVGQTDDVVKLGWSVANKLRLSIGDTDKGNVAMEAWATSQFKPIGYAPTWPISGTPTTFPPSAHNQAISTITGLSAELDSKLDKTGGTISGSLTVTGTLKGATVVETSDASTKINVEPMSLADATAIVLGTRAVRYYSKLEKRPSFGLIANAQAGITPELVKRGDDDLLGMNYGRLVAPLCKVVADLLHRMGKMEDSRGDGS